VSTAALIRENARLEAKVARLEARLAELLRLVHGRSSERVVQEAVAEQMMLFSPEPGPVEAVPDEKKQISYERARSRKEKPFRQPLPADLPHEEIVIEPDFDTTGLKIIGKEVTKELEYVPGHFKVICYIRYKYADPNREEAGVKIAPLPSRPIEKAIAGAGLLARIIVDKFVDHLPFYRQQRRFRRAGFHIPLSTLEGWFSKSCDLLAVLYDLLRAEVTGADYLQADETPLRVIDLLKMGRTHRGFHWIYHAPAKKLALFDYRPGRSRAGPKELLKDFKGWLQTDGYPVYDWFESREGTLLTGCWAHARRYFERALKAYPGHAGRMIGWVRELYAVERMARAENLTPGQRLKLRASLSVPVLKKIAGWLVEMETKPAFVPKDPLGKAHQYLLNRFDYLLRYLEDGRLEIDNNLAENLIRPIAVGRKNYLFAGSHKGAERAAMVYSLTASCKLHGIDPFAYFKDVLSRLPDYSIQKLHELLPHNWKPLHP